MESTVPNNAPAAEAASPPERIADVVSYQQGYKDGASATLKEIIMRNLDARASRPAPEQARLAAEEIARRWLAHDLPMKAQLQSLSLLQLEILALDVIERHLNCNERAAAPSPEQRRNAEKTAAIVEEMKPFITEDPHRRDYALQRLAGRIEAELSAPQGDFRAGVAACVEKVKERLRYHESKSLTNGWSGNQSGPCCEKCAMRDEHFNGRADALKALVGCRNPFQIPEVCECHKPTREAVKTGVVEVANEIIRELESITHSAVAPAARGAAEIDYDLRDDD